MLPTSLPIIATLHSHPTESSVIILLLYISIRLYRFQAAMGHPCLHSVLGTPEEGVMLYGVAGIVKIRYKGPGQLGPRVRLRLQRLR